MAKKKTHKEFVNEIKEKYGDEYIVLGEYKGANTKLMIKHNNCGHEWNVVPDSLLRGHGCPKCGRVKSNQKKRKMHEIFVKEIYDKCGDKYTVLGKYINTKTKVLVKHNCKECNFHEWEITPDNLLRGNGCPVCGKEINKINNKEFQRMFKEKYGDEFTLLDEYSGSRNKMRIRHNCEYCGNHIRIMRADSILKELKCRVCEELEYNEKTFKEKLSKKEKGSYELISEYKNKNTKVLIRHKCGYSWKVEPSVILGNRGCPKCNGGIKSTHEEFIQKIQNRFKNSYSILGTYVNNHTKIKVRHNCKKCKYNEWEIKPSSLLNGAGCPVCANQKAVLGINTIWDTDRWMINLGISEEDAKRYTRCSGQKIIVKCPDCGREKKKRIANIYNERSISCSCGDGKSYPEKFVYNLLEQLGVNFEIEYSPSWIDNKRYDFHIKDNDCIVETHGGQHYDISFKNIGGRTLEEEQQNDKYKKETALKNGIKHYIELDCRESNLEWIKNSILNSELNDLFDLSNVNWTSCAEFANKNIVKEVCDYWNNKKKNETTKDLARMFKLDRHTIIRYLKKELN